MTFLTRLHLLFFFNLSDLLKNVKILGLKYSESFNLYRFETVYNFSRSLLYVWCNISIIVLLKGKKKYRGMFATQKVRRHDKFRKEWSQHCSNKNADYLLERLSPEVHENVVD